MRILNLLGKPVQVTASQLVNGIADDGSFIIFPPARDDDNEPIQAGISFEDSTEIARDNLRLSSSRAVVYGLPEKTPGVLYIVPEEIITLISSSGRDDVLYPTGIAQNNERIIICNGLGSVRVTV